MLLCRSPLQVTPVHLGKETLGVTTELAAADGHQLSRHGHRAQSLATMTSEALITAYAGSPAFRPSSSTASLVMDEVMMVPPPTSIFTWAVVAPRFTSRILPLMMFRALRRMVLSLCRDDGPTAASLLSARRAVPPGRAGSFRGGRRCGRRQFAGARADSTLSA